MQFGLAAIKILKFLAIKMTVLFQHHPDAVAPLWVINRNMELNRISVVVSG